MGGWRSCNSYRNISSGELHIRWPAKSVRTATTLGHYLAGRPPTTPATIRLTTFNATERFVPSAKSDELIIRRIERFTSVLVRLTS